MPPGQRIPSLPGATQASKKAFKPPARVLSDSNSTDSAALHSNAPSDNSAAKLSRANPNASRPTSASSSRAGSTAPTRTVAYKPSRPMPTSGFTRATNVEDIEMISSDDEDMSAAFESLTARQAPRPVTKAVESEPKMSTSKRQRLTRLPSLSDSSTEPTRGLSPVDVNDLNMGSRRHTQQDEVENMGTEADEIPLLSAPLLTRLLYESFDDKQLKISKDANALMTRYLDVFVREAVARAALAQKERKESGEVGLQNDADDDIWLDTKDLAEIAPGLVLDF